MDERIERLREALAPFAVAGANVSPNCRDDMRPGTWAHPTAGQLRKAHAAYTAITPSEGDGAGEEALAEVVHRGRFPADRPPTPWADEDASSKEYCHRIARLVLATLSPRPPVDVEGLVEAIARARHPRVWAAYDAACASPSVTHPATFWRDQTLDEARSILSIPALAEALRQPALPEKGEEPFKRVLFIEFDCDDRPVAAVYQEDGKEALRCSIEAPALSPKPKGMRKALEDIRLMALQAIPAPHLAAQQFEVIAARAREGLAANPEKRDG